MRVLKFLITGLIGLGVNLGTFHLLVVLGLPYLAGSVIAFVVAMLVGFILQKYWTFDDRTPGRTQLQLISYALLALTNLAVNTLIVYLLVEHLHVHYLLAQAAGAGLVAGVSYLIYRHHIFTSALE